MTRDQIIALLVQASKFDFYFSHRIWFFFRSVLYNIKEKEKEDQQKVATDRLIKALWASIVEKIIDDEETKQMTQIDPNKNSYIFLQQKTQSE